MNTFGYVRVSDVSQNEDRQMISMAEQGIPAKNIYVDKQSGKDFERKAYRSMLRRLRPGDCIVLHSLDRLGRDYAAILEQWQLITKDKGADIVVLDMPLLDTREKDRDLTGRLISDIIAFGIKAGRNLSSRDTIFEPYRNRVCYRIWRLSGGTGPSTIERHYSFCHVPGIVLWAGVCTGSHQRGYTAIFGRSGARF